MIQTVKDALLRLLRNARTRSRLTRGTDTTTAAATATGAADRGAAGNRQPRKGTATPAKHLPFFKLTEACSSGQCPICNLRRTALETYLESLVYQGVNDRGFRAEFDRNHGFCTYHEHAFLAKQDRLAVVITHRQLVAQALGELSGHAGAVPSSSSRPGPQTVQTGTQPSPPQTPPTGPGSGARTNRRRTQAAAAARRCQICDRLHETEKQYLATIMTYIDDEELQGYLRSSAGLCLPHFRKLAARADGVPAWLQELQRSRLQHALEAIDEYTRVANYSVSGDSSRLFAAHLRALPDTLVGTLFGYNQDQDPGL